MPEFRALQESSGEAASLQELGLSDAEIRLWRQRAQKVAGRGLRGGLPTPSGLTAWFACGAAWPRFLSSAAAALHKPFSANRPWPPSPSPLQATTRAPPRSPRPGREEGSCPALSRCPGARAASPHRLVCFRALGLGLPRRLLWRGSEPSRRRWWSASASSPCRSTLQAASPSAGVRWRSRGLFSREQTTIPFCGCCIAKVWCLSGPIRGSFLYFQALVRNCLCLLWFR